MVFPAPEGQERTNSRPRRPIPPLLINQPAFPSPLPGRLFYVLNLFAKLFDDRLEIKPRAGEIEVLGLGAQGVGLAIELLGKEIETPPNDAATVYQFPRLGDMSAESVDLFADVGLGDHDGYILCKSIFGKCMVAGQKFLQLFLDAGANGIGLGRGKFTGAADQAFDLVEESGQDLDQALAFFAPGRGDFF